MKKEIKVYTKLNNVEECNLFFAIIQDDVIKYIDLENNKMTIDKEKGIIIRENREYLFTMNFKDNIIKIYAKKLKSSFDKEIKTIVLENTKKRFIVRYLLSDETIVNEYCIYF